MLAGCQCANITNYYGSVLAPGTTELMIIMELLACSVADLVGAVHHIWMRGWNLHGEHVL